jgi:hypothetical protein
LADFELDLQNIENLLQSLTKKKIVAKVIAGASRNEQGYQLLDELHTGFTYECFHAQQGYHYRHTSSGKLSLLTQCRNTPRIS